MGICDAFEGCVTLSRLVVSISLRCLPISPSSEIQIRIFFSLKYGVVPLSLLRGILGGHAGVLPTRLSGDISTSPFVAWKDARGLVHSPKHSAEIDLRQNPRTLWHWALR
jgi:hypothetical protein